MRLNIWGRLEQAFLRAVAAFFIAGITSCVAFTMAVSGSHDGQAGMGAAFGGFYAACIASIVTFIVSMRRSSPNRKKNVDTEA
jgi:O-antigen/teichoic acid export membrane protein